MDVSFLVLFVLPDCFSCSASILPKSRAKVVEEYVVSANFDSGTNFPQLSDRSQLREIHPEDDDRRRQEAGGGSSLYLPSPRRSHRDPGDPLGNFDHGGALEERDYLVHHHLPPAPHPPPVGLAHAPSLFAVGFITFLILLNSLQTSLLILKSKGPALGSVSAILGRRKRFASENIARFLEQYGKDNR